MTDNKTENSIQAGKIYIINPMLGTLKTADHIADAEKPGLKDILEMVRIGACDTFTLPSGDRLVAGKGSIGLVSELAKKTAAIIGKFAFMKEMPDFEKNPELLRTFTASEANVLEVAGPAMLVGPVVSADDASVTSTTLSDLDVKMLVAWDGATRARMAVLGDLADRTADNDNAEWDESVYDDALAKHRMTLTDEELVACPCPGCKDELARRAVAAGGSAAIN